MIGTSNKSSVCFCLSPLSQTYHILLSSTAFIIVQHMIFEDWRQVVSSNKRVNSQEVILLVSTLPRLVLLFLHRGL
jgi:hypothetical protein